MLRRSYGILGAVTVKQYPERKKQQIHWQKCQSAGGHVLLGIAEILARQIFLHHVLIKPRHNYHNEDSGNELFPEKLSAFPIVKYKDSSVRAFAYKVNRTIKVQVHGSRYGYPYSSHCRYESQCLQRIGPHERFHTAFSRVSPG